MERAEMADRRGFDGGECLFVVIPGIGGSVLERAGVAVWEGTRRLGERLWEPEALELGVGDGIRAVGAVEGFRVLPGLVALGGYPKLVGVLEGLDPSARTDAGHPDQPDLGARIVVFPYDFRRSIAEASTLLDRCVRRRVEHLGGSVKAGRKRVIVIAHSMGGLVARHWIATCPDAAGLTRLLVTLGTPHRGAPKALDVVVNGLRLGPLRLPQRHADIVRGWPGLYELLPRYRAVSNGDGGAYPKDVLIGPAAEAASEAFAVHTRIEQAWTRLGTDAPVVLPVFGVGEATCQHAVLGPAGAFTASTQPAAWLGIAGLAGDGTVPAVSAVPIEMDNDNDRDRLLHRPQPGAKHAWLVAWAGLAGALRHLLAGSTGHVRGPAPGVISLDLDDAWPAGTSMPVGARVHAPLEPQDVDLVPAEDVMGVQFRVVRAGVPSGGWVDAECQDGWWRTQLPAGAPGRVTIQARAATGAGDDPEPRSEPVEIADPEDLG
jgi:pimeloyl-ACP methyl ester carboxylesterase